MSYMRIIGTLKYLIICLVLIMIDKSGDSSFVQLHDGFNNESSEIRNTGNNFLSAENPTFSMPENECRIPRQSNFSTSLRTFSQAQRNMQSSHSRHGFTLIKTGKSLNVNTIFVYLNAIINFPSGMNEANHHLISLRKLII